jgi:hypothetical protein
MTITSKFAGTCTTCRQRFAAGTLVDWTKGGGAAHADATACAAALATAQAAQAQQATGPKVDGSGLRTFLQAAAERGLKFPKARFLAPDGQSELLLSLATAKSRNPGALYVKLSGEYIGMVRVDGSTNLPGDVVATLATIAANPAEAAKAYGALTCRCSFCGLHLTDAGSVEVGYGPVCADKWNLPHQPKGTPVLLAVPSAA